MRLFWNEIRVRAAVFAKEWQDAAYEKDETHSFYNDFFDIFGVKRRTVARYEEHVKRLDNLSDFVDLFWPGVLLVEQKSAGRDLTRAYRQAGDYFDALPERDRPRYILVSDFQTLVGTDERLNTDYLVIPDTSSERREYVPIGWLTPEVIANQQLRILPDATLTEFALLTSTMHMARMRTVTGCMKSDYMYSVGVVYNTFPTPPEGADLSNLEPLSHAALDARAAHSGATLADLYDPGPMPPNLRRAHTALDRAVDRFYRRGGFASERERVEHLFGLYEKMATPLTVKPKRRRERRPPPGWTR